MKTQFVSNIKIDTPICGNNVSKHKNRKTHGDFERFALSILTYYHALEYQALLLFANFYQL